MKKIKYFSATYRYVGVFMFLSILINASPKLYQSLGSEIESFNSTCKQYKKINKLPSSINKKCTKFYKDTNKVFKIGYKFDKMNIEKVSEKRKSKYLRQLRKLDNDKEIILNLIQTEKKKARVSNSINYYSQLININSTWLASSDYEFMDKNKKLFMENDRYTSYAKEKEYRKHLKKEKTKQVKNKIVDTKVGDKRSEWKYDNKQDEMSQETMKMAYIKSANKLNFGSPYNGSQSATLSLRKHPRHGNNIMLQIEKGQFLCNRSNGCTLLVRFDNNPPVRYTAVEPSDHSSTLLFIKNYVGFVAKTKKSKKIYIEATFYQEGSQMMEFNSEGLNF